MLRIASVAYPGVAALLLAFLPQASAADVPSERAAMLRQAVELACPEDDTTALRAALPDARLLESETIGIETAPIGRRTRFVLASGDRLVLERLAPGGRLRRFSASYASVEGGEIRPQLMALADGRCRIVQGRALDWGDNGGGPDSLILLEPDLASERGREPLDPPVPAGHDPGGVIVAQVDAGVAYDLPAIAERLARDEAGGALGYDFWDLDPRPYDANPATSPFFPVRHGTEVASLLLAEAPESRLLPYRYPRPDMDRMADLVEAAAEAGATIVALPMGSNSGSLWTAFLTTAAARPELLFIVSAGNDGRDIDAHPVWPAAAGLDNLLTVTSSEADGRLARGSNWGAESVDLLVPAERQQVFDYRGRTHRASGSSFAVPRIAALAARLKARHPAWDGPALKRAILELAEPAPEPGRVKVGWIRDPLASP